MDLWTHSFLKNLRHANHVYWCIRMKKLHTDGSFGLTWFWITWDMQIIPHGQDDWKASFFSKMEQDSNSLEVTHFDVCSPMSVEACSEYRYVLTSQMIRVDVEYIYLMNHESELLKGNFSVKLKDRRDKRIKCLWYDHRDEYLSYEFWHTIKTLWKLFRN